MPPQDGPQVLVQNQERPSYAMTDGVCPAVNAAALDFDRDVELPDVIGVLEDFLNRLTVAYQTKYVLQRLPVYHNGAVAIGIYAHTGNRRLAPAQTVVIMRTTDHVNLPLSQPAPSHVGPGRETLIC